MPEAPPEAHRCGGGSLGPWRTLWLLLTAAAVFWPGLASLPPVDRDETRYMQASAQMLERRDWIDIRFQDHPRYAQPAGIYWLQCATTAALSNAQARDAWTYRLPSYLAAVGSVLVTGLIGARLFGATAGVLAALLLCSTLLLNIEARLAKTDAVLLLSVLVAHRALAEAWCRRGHSRQVPRRWSFLLGGALGAGLLIKGPVILLFVALTALALTAQQRQINWFMRLRPVLALILAGLIALPWYIAIGQISDGAFFVSSFGQNHLGKLFEAQQGHWGLPGYHALLASVTLWPAGLLLAFALPWIWRERREPSIAFCLAWAIPTWLLFELVATKLPHYMLPIFPALTLLAAAGLQAQGRTLWRTFDERPRLRDFLVGGWLVLGLLIALGPATLTLALDRSIRAPALSGALVALTCLLVFSRLPRRLAPQPFALALPVLSLAVVGLNLWLVLPRLESVWVSPRLVEAAAAASPCARPWISSLPFREESLVFLAGTETLINLPAAALAERITSAKPTSARCAVLVLDRPAWVSVTDALARRGWELQTLEIRVRGINYSKAQSLDLGLFRPMPRRPSAPPPTANPEGDA